MSGLIFRRIFGEIVCRTDGENRSLSSLAPGGRAPHAARLPHWRRPAAVAPAPSRHGVRDGAVPAGHDAGDLPAAGILPGDDRHGGVHCHGALHGGGHGGAAFPARDALRGYGASDDPDVGGFLGRAVRRPRTKQEELCRRFEEELRAHYMRERQVAFYAGRLCVTPKYLSAVVRQQTGRTAQACIETYVVTESKALLLSTDLSVQQIADRLNFPSQSVFGKYFKRATGLSPRAFRNRMS